MWKVKYSAAAKRRLKKLGIKENTDIKELTPELRNKIGHMYLIFER